jgi:inorganic pyrophosphatase
VAVVFDEFRFETRRCATLLIHHEGTDALFIRDSREETAGPRKAVRRDDQLFQIADLGRPGPVYAVVETPRGSRVKLEFDPKLGAFTQAKPLFAGLTYPYDWGFIPSTQADDGDPLDVLIIHDAATYPGLVLRCTPVGVLEVEQSSNGKKERNDRVFVVPDRSPFEGDLQDIRRLPARAIKELEEFFLATNALEAKTLKFLGWRGPAKAIKTIKETSR